MDQGEGELESQRKNGLFSERGIGDRIGARDSLISARNEWGFHWRLWQLSAQH